MSFPRNLRIETSFLSRRSQSQPPPESEKEDREKPVEDSYNQVRSVDDHLDDPFSQSPSQLPQGVESLSGRYYSDISDPEGIAIRVSKYSDHEYEPIGEPISSEPDFRGDEKRMRPVVSPEAEGEPGDHAQPRTPPHEGEMNGSLDRECTPLDDRYAKEDQRLQDEQNPMGANEQFDQFFHPEESLPLDEQHPVEHPRDEEIITAQQLEGASQPSEEGTPRERSPVREKKKSKFRSISLPSRPFKNFSKPRLPKLHLPSFSKPQLPTLNKENLTMPQSTQEVHQALYNTIPKSFTRPIIVSRRVDEDPEKVKELQNQPVKTPKELSKLELSKLKLSKMKLPDISKIQKPSLPKSLTDQVIVSCKIEEDQEEVKHRKELTATTSPKELSKIKFPELPKLQKPTLPKHLPKSFTRPMLVSCKVEENQEEVKQRQELTARTTPKELSKIKLPDLPKIQKPTLPKHLPKSFTNTMIVSRKIEEDQEGVRQRQNLQATTTPKELSKIKLPKVSVPEKLSDTLTRIIDKKRSKSKHTSSSPPPTKKSRPYSDFYTSTPKVTPTLEKRSKTPPPQRTWAPTVPSRKGTEKKASQYTDHRYANTSEDFGYAIILEDGEVSLTEEQDNYSRRSRSEEGGRSQHGGGNKGQGFHRGMRDEDMARMIEADLRDRDRERKLQADIRDEDVVRRMLEAEREEEIRLMVEADIRDEETQRMLEAEMFQPPLNSLAMMGDSGHSYRTSTPPSRPSRSRAPKRGPNATVGMHTIERSGMAVNHVEPCEDFSPLTFPPTRPKRSKRSKSSPPRVLCYDEDVTEGALLEEERSEPLRHEHKHGLGAAREPLTQLDSQWLTDIESQIIPEKRPGFSTLPPMRPKRDKQNMPPMTATLPPPRPRREKQKRTAMDEVEQALMEDIIKSDFPGRFQTDDERVPGPEDELIPGDEDELAHAKERAQLSQMEEEEGVDRERAGLTEGVGLEGEEREMIDMDENEEASLELIIDSVDMTGEARQRLKTPDYAKVVKKASAPKKKPPRPPPPVSPSRKSDVNEPLATKPVNYSYFFTLPRRTPRTYYIIPPSAPPRAYCTIRPRRPPRKVKLHSDSAEIGDLIDQVKQHLSQRRHSIGECEQVMSVAGVGEIAEDVSRENLKGLLSSQVLDKMKGRPLPAPPRPPRTRSMPRSIAEGAVPGFEAEEAGDHAQPLEMVETVGPQVEEVCVSTQTDPILDDLGDEAFPQDIAQGEEAVERRRRSIGSSVSEKKGRSQESSSAPPMFPSFPSRLTLNELEVNRLTVQEVHAMKIIVSEIDGMQLQVAELATSGGPLLVTLVPQRPSMSDEKGQEHEEEEEEEEVEVEVEEQDNEVEIAGEHETPEMAEDPSFAEEDSQDAYRPH